MRSVQESHDDNKWKAATSYLERVLLLIERVWRESRTVMDLSLRQRFRHWHQALGQLHEALATRQNGTAS